MIFHKLLVILRKDNNVDHEGILRVVVADSMNPTFE